MSASHEWSVWHLTPRGWEQGNWKIDFGDVHKKEPPSDRVLTCKYHEKMSSVFSKMDVYINEEWRSDKRTEVSELLEKYGACPESL